MFCAQNITHKSQWEIAEDLEVSCLIQFIQLEGTDFSQTTLGPA